MQFLDFIYESFLFEIIPKTPLSILDVNSILLITLQSYPCHLTPKWHFSLLLYTFWKYVMEKWLSESNCLVVSHIIISLFQLYKLEIWIQSTAFQKLSLNSPKSLSKRVKTKTTLYRKRQRRKVYYTRQRQGFIGFTWLMKQKIDTLILFKQTDP